MDKERDNSKNVAKYGDFDSFSSSELLGFILKKTERLVSASYLVTESFEKDEPLKWSIRDKNLEMLEVAHFYIKDIGYDKEKATRVLLGVMKEIISLFEVAKITGLVSVMNFQIMRQEYLLLSKYIKDKSLILKIGSISIDPSFFEIDYNTIGETPKIMGNTKNIAGGGYFHKGHYKGQNSIKDKYKMSFMNNLNRSLNKDNSSQTNSSLAKQRGQNSGQKTDRKTQILNILKSKKDASIKDISFVIKGCSEKTIQRELMELLGQGAISKTGERRWSRYSLK